MTKPRILDYDESVLTEEEKKVVNLLLEVGKIIHLLWEKQFDENLNYISMFPKDSTKEEIIEESKKNAQILDPYTVVKKEKNGNFIAVHYSEEYKTEIKQIVSLLEEASSYTSDNILKEYLKEIADSYSKGDFNRALEAYVKREDTKIALLMGPIETYLDKIFGVKKAWQFNLRITVKDETDRIKKMFDLVKSKVLVKPLGSTAQDIAGDKIKISVCDVLMFSGRQAGSFTSSTNLPEDPEMVKKYGTKIVFYRNSMNDKFETLVKKYLGLITGVDIQGKEEMIAESYFNLIALHEIVEASIQYENIRGRMQGYSDAIREFHAFLVGIKNAIYMALNGYFTEDQFNMIMISYFLYGLDVLNRKESNPSIIEYARGFAILFNYGIQKGVFEITSEGFIKINRGLMEELTKLTGIVMEVYSVGNYSDVSGFFETYCDFSFEKKIDFSKAI